MLSIKVLGTGCAKCNKLYAEAERAVAATGVEAKLEKVEELDDIVAYGVMMTPALVIDEVVVSSGRLPSQAKLVSMLTKAAKVREA